jgi:hypothetical protein
MEKGRPNLTHSHEISDSKGEYNGQWMNDQQHGQGTFISPSGHLKITGQFTNNFAHGKCTLIKTITLDFSSTLSESPIPATTFTSTYNGHLYRNKYHGKGKMVYPNGDTFKGNWVDGIRSGEGRLVTKAERYQGKWEGDRFVQGRVQRGAKWWYVGEIKGGVMHGVGEWVNQETGVRK